MMSSVCSSCFKEAFSKDGSQKVCEFCGGSLSAISYSPDYKPSVGIHRIQRMKQLIHELKIKQQQCIENLNNAETFTDRLVAQADVQLMNCDIDDLEDAMRVEMRVEKLLAERYSEAENA